jgi:hypothetical protein
MAIAGTSGTGGKVEERKAEMEMGGREVIRAVPGWRADGGERRPVEVGPNLAASRAGRLLREERLASQRSSAMERRTETSMSPSSSTGISASCLAKEIMAARGSGKDGQVRRTSLAALRKSNSSTLERPVKKRAKREVVVEETSLTEMRE